MSYMTDPRQPTARSGDREGLCCSPLHHYKNLLAQQRIKKIKKFATGAYLLLKKVLM